MRAVIYYEPTRVSVSDDRDSVDGAWIQIQLADGTEDSGEIVPPEGDHPDCWLGALSDYFDDLGDALEEAVSRAEQGASGVLVREVIRHAG